MRKSWDHYFMDMAYMAASRATCPRRHVGAILVKDKKILGTAYNGAPAGVPDCYEAGCMLVETYEEEDGQMVRKERCIRAIHAEQNLLLFTDREDRQGATVYVTDQPCWTCTNMLANSGIAEIVYHRAYAKDQDKVRALLKQKGIVLRHLSNYVPPAGLKREVVE
ncbi:deaminase [Caldalkalibacillus thermarum]|uniref:deoxycytidylate deaminase n=1 Tax=Caldalkalibacillus thermarum TaxID=296745 RepID=UPI00166845D2|nr:dCMP deaminase family protein [Caldalkalibacillus thermarum]GGK18305.1 deaminase [Caldalkalibacillus thermarum]